MAVQITKQATKKVTKATAKVKQEEPLLSKDVLDIYLAKKADYEKKAAKLAPLAKELSDMEAQFVGVVDESVADDKDVLLTGTDPTLHVHVSAKGQNTTITDKPKLIELLGQEQFNELATIGITDARKYLTPKQMDAISATERKTKRRLKVVND